MIAVRDLAARVGDFELRAVTFEVPTRQYGVVIGPAGSGKTTLLETIAGIVRTRGGAVLLGDSDGRARDATLVAPERRGIGIVYQQALLFPHLSVAENIAYGARDSVTAEVAAARIGADALVQRPVRALSGGERQLVALARALAARPAILLLDEPFSALDPRRRAAVRREVRALHREWGMTVLQVTHDFTEAGLLGDVAILLDAGRVLQFGPPERVFREPASPYIAEFLGAENVLAGTVRWLEESAPDWADAESDAPGAHEAARARRPIEFTAGALRLYTVGDAPEGSGYAVIRAEEILLSFERGSTSARNAFRGRVTDVAPVGALTRVTIDCSGVPLVAALTTRSAQELALTPGREVVASFKAVGVHLC